MEKLNLSKISNIVHVYLVTLLKLLVEKKIEINQDIGVVLRYYVILCFGLIFLNNKNIILKNDCVLNNILSFNCFASFYILSLSFAR